jgi:phospholipid/cholesterol/gamma-HCH transport system substrate-binding protein
MRGLRGTIIKLTIFTLFTASVTALLASVIGNFRPLRGRYTLEAVFEDATGLLRGDLVTLAGVNVGKVKDARVERGLAIVELLIDDEVVLPKTTRLQIRYRNLIGQRVVQIVPGTKRPPFYKHRDRVPAKQTDGPLDLDVVFNNLRPLVEGIEGQDINTLSKALIVSFGQRKADLDAVFSDTAKLTTELAARDEKLGSLVANLNTTASALASERSQLQRLVGNFATVTQTLAENSVPLDRTLTNLNQALGDFAGLIERNRPGLDNDLRDIATLLDIVDKHQADLRQIAGSLDEVLRASARATTTGEWGNLYVFSLCSDGQFPECRAPTVTTADAFKGAPSGEAKSILYGAVGGER